MNLLIILGKPGFQNQKEIPQNMNFLYGVKINLTLEEQRKN